MSRLIVPIAGFGLLAILSFTLIVAVVIRPWGGQDRSWRTHMNLAGEPYSDYTRAPQSFVSAEGAAPILVWNGTDSVDSTESHWVTHGCASCHGLDAAGGVVGPNLLAMTASDIEDRARFGPKGMPAFQASDLPDGHFAALASYVEEMARANPGAVPTPTPGRAAATPTGQSTAVTNAPTATPTVQPAGSAIATPGPTIATPGPTVEATAALAASPTAPASNGAGDDLLAQGKRIYNETAGISGQGCAYCHGLDGKGAGEGASNAPDIRGMSRSKVRAAMTNAADMRDIKLSAEEIDAIVEYLRYLNQ